MDGGKQQEGEADGDAGDRFMARSPQKENPMSTSLSRIFLFDTVPAGNPPQKRSFI
jgi:hypothetical protein